MIKKKIPQGWYDLPKWLSYYLFLLVSSVYTKQGLTLPLRKLNSVILTIPNVPNKKKPPPYQEIVLYKDRTVFLNFFLYNYNLN